MNTPTEIMTNAEAMVVANLGEACYDLHQWEMTGKLAPHSVVRDIARELAPLGESKSLSLAKHLISSAAIKKVGES